MFEFFAAIGEWYAKTKWIQNVVTAVQIITAVMGVKGFLQAKNMLGKGQDILANYGGFTTISISSAASDANGYGTFEYAPPSGYYALCTKNLAEYG